MERGRVFVDQSRAAKALPVAGERHIVIQQ
jgi:hypothetical protein